MAYLRTRAFYLLFALWTILLVVTVPVLFLDRDGRHIRRVSRLWSRGIRVLLRWVAGIDHRIVGHENRPDGSALYVANHQSMWEALLFNLLVPDCAIVLRENLFKIPLVGPFLKRSPMIGIRRDNMGMSTRKLIRDAKAAVAAGRSVVIFPEGTRAAPEAETEFKSGYEILYRYLGVSAVPVAHNAGLFWRHKSKVMQPGTVTLEFLPSIAPGMKPAEFGTLVDGQVQERRKALVSSPI